MFLLLTSRYWPLVTQWSGSPRSARRAHTIQPMHSSQMQNTTSRHGRAPAAAAAAPIRRRLQGASRSSSSSRRHIAAAAAAAAGEPVCLASLPSSFNAKVEVFELPDSPSLPPELRNTRVLLLDDSGNLHSVFRPDPHHPSPNTGAYWDCLALLPALVPPGPIAILGLGAGSIAHLLAAYYPPPSRTSHGWELDPAVVTVARQHMGLAQLEQRGCLVVHTGDALSDSATVGPGGAAGIIVDLFGGGQLIPQLTTPAAWAGIRQRLAPGGRVIANLGAALGPAATGGPAGQQLPGADATRAALAAMAEVFGASQLSCCNLLYGPCANMIAITGPLGPEEWQQVPQGLGLFARMAWQPWSRDAVF